MKSYVAALLDRGGWQAYEGWLFGRLWAVFDRVRDATPDRPKERALRQGLAELERLDPTDLFCHGMPFFWLNLHRFYATPASAPLLEASRDLLMTAFDSYFSFLPNGATFECLSGTRQTLVLPRLGVSIPDVMRARLCRHSDQSLEIEVDGARQTLNLKQNDPTWRSRTCKVSDDGPETVMAIADSAVAASDVSGIFSEGNMRPFAERISQGLIWIEKTDVELRESMRKLVHWFVPLKMLSASMHASYSEKDAIGVVNLSEGYTGIRLCEALIHEYHHNELFVLQATQELIRHDRGSVYYSPWRNDPRTLLGLLHGIHVFVAVVKFYGAAERISELNFDRPKTRDRRRELCQKLRMALGQVPRNELTALGNGIVQALEDDVGEQERELGLEPGVFSDAICKHALTWRDTNPTFVQYHRLPEKMGELIPLTEHLG